MMTRLTHPAVLLLLLPLGCDDAAPPVPAAPPVAVEPRPDPVPASTRPAYRPEAFRADVTALIAAGRYADATLYLDSADVDRQVEHDGEGYLGVGEDLIVLPGVYPRIYFDRGRDWYIPGTQDAIQDAAWQAAATDFAERYNLRRAAAMPAVTPPATSRRAG